MPELPELPAIAKEPLSVVLLAHDAAGHVERQIREWNKYLNDRPGDWEIILVDDGSQDGTADLAEALALPRFRVLRQPREGEGATLSAGLSAAQYPLVAIAPCDPRYRAMWLDKLLAEIDRVHLVTGFRAAWKTPALVSALGWFWRTFWRLILTLDLSSPPGWLGWKGELGRRLVRALFGVRLRDVACPYRLLRREILGRLPIQSRGRFAHIEMMAKANFVGYLVAEEVPLPVPPVPIFPGESTGHVLAEAWRIFNRPSFGPVSLEPKISEEAALPLTDPEKAISPRNGEGGEKEGEG